MHDAEVERDRDRQRIIFHFILFLHLIQIVVKTRENKREARLKKDRKVIPFSSKK